MTTPTLVLEVQSDSFVRFLFSLSSGAALQRFEQDDGAYVAQGPAAPVAADGVAVALPPGTYLLLGQANRGVGCQVLSGSVSIIVPTGGEDPWPDPTKPALAGGPPFAIAQLSQMPSDVAKLASDTMKRRRS